MKSAAVLLLALCALAAGPDARATVQARDSLTAEGERGLLHELPLRELLAERELRFAARSTANWRGYLARWEIREERLLLTDFNALSRDGGERLGLLQLFPETGDMESPAVFAEWFSGSLHVHLGEVRQRAARGHVLVTERLLLLEIERGIVTGRRVLAHPANLERIEALHGLRLR